MSRLLYESKMGRVSVDGDGNFTTIGSTRTLVCEMAVELNRLRSALQEIASMSGERSAMNGSGIEVEIAREAIK
jgi:hypothetical protein